MLASCASVSSVVCLPLHHQLPRTFFQPTKSFSFTASFVKPVSSGIANKQSTLSKTCSLVFSRDLSCRFLSTPSSTPSAFLARTEEVATFPSHEYRMFFNTAGNNGSKFSPWHFVPLYCGDKKSRMVNMICEMPKDTDAKMEIATKEQWNPIKQDIKKGNLRFIKHGKIPYNYGALPQTWEDPKVIIPNTPYPGDNDPVDVVDISDLTAQRGQIIQLKVLGVLGLIDEGECDWKVIGINSQDPQADSFDDICSLDGNIPKEAIEKVREFYRIYKVCEGKEANSYAFGGKCLCRCEAMNVIADTHDAWKRLMKKGHDKFGLNVFDEL